ncbi:MAG TPA: hypothetical protein VEA92_02505 [Candidatus Paceibacterota bacterium]|nr:hypothetical protein [Candidatus Paceibacterota bacterium]
MTTIKDLIVRVSAGLGLFFVPALAFAQTPATGGNSDFTLEPVSGIVEEILSFVDSTVVPAIFAIAFLVFIWGVYTYFIQGGASEEKRSEGKQLVFWGLIGFFVMFSVWGLVNILVGTLGPDANARPCVPQFSGECAE